MPRQWYVVEHKKIVLTKKTKRAALVSCKHMQHDRRRYPIVRRLGEGCYQYTTPRLNAKMLAYHIYIGTKEGLQAQGIAL